MSVLGRASTTRTAQMSTTLIVKARPSHASRASVRTFSTTHTMSFGFRGARGGAHLEPDGFAEYEKLVPSSVPLRLTCNPEMRGHRDLLRVQDDHPGTDSVGDTPADLRIRPHVDRPAGPPVRPASVNFECIISVRKHGHIGAYRRRCGAPLLVVCASGRGRAAPFRGVCRLTSGGACRSRVPRCGMQFIDSCREA